MADLDGDGVRDMISGSYWPGDLYLFRGQGGTSFAKGEILLDADGKHVNAGPPWEGPKKPQMDSLAAAPWLVDWDGDGDLDLLVGNIIGHVVLIANEGGARAPKFVRKGPIEADGQVLDAGHNDAGPTTADWDGDGLWDLIVGSGDGSVTFYRNEGTMTAPALAAGVALIESTGHRTAAAGEEPQRPGMRLKPHVCDWNGDGLPDLLVGDYVSIQGPAPQLTKEQEQRKQELQQQLDELNGRFGAIMAKVDNDKDKLQGEAKKEFEAVQQQMSKVFQELSPLQPSRKAAGFVWVYLRKPGARTAGAAPVR